MCFSPFACLKYFDSFASSSLLLFVIGLFEVLYSLEVLGLFKVLRVRFRSSGPFLESPETSRRHNSRIFKTKVFPVMKLCSYFNVKRPALQNKQVGVLRMAFRARKVFGSF